MNREESKKLFATANTQVREGGFEELPPDTYYGTLTECKLDKDKKQQDRVVMIIEVTEGEYKGRKQWVFSNLTNTTAVSILFGQWRKLGYDTTGIESLEDIAEHCQAITAAQYGVEFRVWKKGEYTNAGINAVVETVAADAPAEEPAAAAEEEVPEQPAEEPVAEEEGAPEGEEEEGATIEVGMKVTVSIKGQKVSGEVTAVDSASNTIEVKSLKTKKVYKCPLDNVQSIDA